MRGNSLAPYGARLLVCGLLLAAGCGKPSPENERLRQQVLAADPSFSKQLEQRDEIVDQRQLLERELALKRRQVDRQVTQLKRQLNDTTGEVEKKIRELERRLMPERRRLELAKSMAREELRIKRDHRESLGRSIARLRKTLAQEHPQWTDAERSRLDHDLAEYARETERLDREIASLEAHLALLEKKLQTLAL